MKPIQRQQNLQRAEEMAFAAAARQPVEELLWLGAKQAGSRWRLRVLNDDIEVDFEEGSMIAGGRDLSPYWKVLVLHYLAIDSRPPQRPPEVSFGDLAASRSYAGVYHQRVIARLCATVGREAQQLLAAGAGVGGRRVEAGDVGFDFDVFPRLSLRLIWHAGDEEFSSSAVLLMPANIEAFFCIEDTVVLSECLTARLSGRPIFVDRVAGEPSHAVRSRGALRRPEPPDGAV